MSDFSKRLKTLQSKWKKAKNADPSEYGGGGGNVVPDGIYLARVSGELTESQSSGRMQVAWEAVITEGEQKGEVVRDYDGMDTDQNLFYLQKRLARLGVEISDDPGDVEEALADITKDKPLCKIRVRTKDDFTHFLINKKMDDGEESGEVEETEEETEVEEETGTRLEKGMKVTFSSGGKDLEGEILEFTDDDSKARVKTEKGVFKVAVDKLTPAEGETEPVDPEPEAEEEEEPEEEEAEIEEPEPKKGKKSSVKKLKK